MLMEQSRMTTDVHECEVWEDRSQTQCLDVDSNEREQVAVLGGVPLSVEDLANTINHLNSRCSQVLENMERLMYEMDVQRAQLEGVFAFVSREHELIEFEKKQFML